MVVRAFIMSISVMLWLRLIQLSQVASYLNPESKCDNESCGDWKIPYPFGISKNCYYDKSFQIECKKIEQTEQPGGTPYYTPYLKIMDLEVSGIHDNTLEIYVPVFNSCEDVISGYDFRATPFSFSSSNVLVAVGYNILAYTTDQDNHVMAWCVTGDTGFRPDYDMCSSKLRQNIKTFKPMVQSTINKTIIISNSSIDQQDVICGKGFLIDQSWYEIMTKEGFIEYTDPWGGRMPVYLNWELYNVTAASFGVNNITTSCISKPIWFQVNDVFYSNTTFQCFCKDGYEGDPYVSQGCQEIPIWEPKRKINWKLVVIGVSSAIGALILAFLLWWLFKKVKKEIIRRYKAKYFKRNGGLLLQQQVSSNDGNIEKTKIFSSYELEKATDNYNVDRVLGHGGQGTVYKGMLSDGKIIAVKRSIIIDTTKISQFINEVVILSQINHRNIVKLLGCCLETEVPLLVYEFISNGTLFHHIQDPNEDFHLTWEMRLRIASEVAGALSYMHSAASLPIYHRDIKSTNILLDEKYKARVSDFGLSRSVDVDKTHFTTIVQGTFGYLDPEYFQSSQFTEKSDVYSFGVVLVELLTGKKPIFSNSSLEFRGLASHFIESMEQNRFLEIIDPHIPKEDKIEEMVAVAHLAKICLNLMGRKRPTMKEVAVQLENIRMSKETICSHDNCEAMENFGIEIECDFDSPSMSTGTWSETSTTWPKDVLPLLTYP